MRAALPLTAAALLLVGTAKAQAQHQGQHQSHAPTDHGAMDHDMTGHRSTDDHSGHVAHGGTQSADPPVTQVAPGATDSLPHAADTVYGSSVMAQARAQMLREHGDMTTARLMADRLEFRRIGGEDGVAWDADLWVGKDIDKLWIKTEGEAELGEAPEHAEVQALWSHAVGPWFDIQAGVRHDTGAGPDRTHAVIGLRGLLPYWIELDGAIFLSHKGDLTARAEVEHDVRIAPRLIVQARGQADLSAQAAPNIGLGSGVTGTALGLRLRYEITPRFAPYAGVEWQQAHGATARTARARGDDPGGIALVAGIRLWF